MVFAWSNSKTTSTAPYCGYIKNISTLFDKIEKTDLMWARLFSWTHIFVMYNMLVINTFLFVILRVGVRITNIDRFSKSISEYLSFIFFWIERKVNAIAFWSFGIIKLGSDKELTIIIYNTDVGWATNLSAATKFHYFGVHTLYYSLFSSVYTQNICFIIRSVIALKALGWPVSHTKQMELSVIQLKRQHSGMAT